MSIINTTCIKTDREGNYIGNGSFSAAFHTEKIDGVSVSVNKSESTESVYVTYTNDATGQRVVVRFSHHINNAVKFGDQLDGYITKREEIMFNLGLAKRIFTAELRLYIHWKQIQKSQLLFYEEADLSIKEMYDMGAGADLTPYKGKLAKGSNYLILSDAVTEYPITISGPFGFTRIKGHYEYSIC